ncbi:unnamed protein product [Sphagnum jensenii]|uniref:Uncharacterized protein n=1 Tax=Sphagnum jensenii TaxID=128206 RepID=A0ABP0VR63_9BRYO
MAFGRRTAATGVGGSAAPVGATGYGTGVNGSAGGTGYGTGAGTGRVGPTRSRWGRRNAGAAVAGNKLAGGPKTKFTDMRAASGRRMSVAGAKIGEKLAHLRANMGLALYTVAHPIHPIRRAAAKESAVNTKAAATERKNQKIARANDVAYRKRAVVRENRAARLNTAL